MPIWKHVVPGILILAGCARPQPAPPAQRLVDDFSPALVSGTRAGAAPKPMMWQFDGPSPVEAVAGIRDLAVRDGRLTGVATTASPVLRLGSVPGVDPDDLVHEVRIRMRVSSGKSCGAHLAGRRAELLRRTVSTPHAWDAVSVDLDAWSSREVTLTLSLEAEEAGALGLWGAPAVRRRGPLGSWCGTSSGRRASRGPRSSCTTSGAIPGTGTTSRPGTPRWWRGCRSSSMPGKRTRRRGASPPARKRHKA